METMSRSKVTDRTLLFYVAIVCLWSWLAWWPVVVRFRAEGHEGAPVWSYVLLLLGAYAPSLVALGFTGRWEGRDGVRQLLRRLVAWRVGARWWAVAFLLPVVTALGGLWIYALRGGELGALSFSRWFLVPALLLAALPFGPLGEELGWRGYLLPALLQRRGPFVSSILVGLVWTFWHTPLFWTPAGTSISGVPVTVSSVGGYFLLLAGYSVCLTWLLSRTTGSVLMAVVFHASGSAAVYRLFLPDLFTVTRWEFEQYSIIPLWILVAILIATKSLGGIGGQRSGTAND